MRRPSGGVRGAFAEYPERGSDIRKRFDPIFAVISPVSASALEAAAPALMIERDPSFGPMHRAGGIAMEPHARVAVSLEWSSLCVLDAAGQIIRTGEIGVSNPIALMW